MIRIQVLIDGTVVGDVGRVIAYENQTQSEPIQFMYPPFKGADTCIKKVKYYWGGTQFMDLLDSNNCVRVHVHGAGILTMQFVAENPVTGEVLLASKTFQLVVHKGLTSYPDSFDNCYRNNYCDCYPNNGNNTANVYEVLVKMGIDLADESRVRASQDSSIWEEIFNIKNKLAESGIITVDPLPIVGDCNEIVSSGETHLAEGSKNTPESVELSENPWILQVRRMVSQVLQTIYCAKSGDSSVYYRTGSIGTDNIVTWTSWIPMIHETSVTEIASD